MTRSKEHEKRFSLKGFTVVELVVVVVVIGILAALTVVAYNGVQQNARDKSLLSDIDAVESELSRNAVSNGGKYSSSLNWDSTTGANSSIKFSPSPGNVLSVIVQDDSSYCIKAYNPQSSSKTASTAKTKGDCTVKWKAVTTYYRNTCAISTANKLYCWGPNINGSLGNGTSASTNVPVLVSQGDIPTDVTINSVAVGLSTTCALGSDGNAYCWGGNAYLKSFGYDRSYTPVLLRGAVPNGVTIKQVEPTGNHMCVLGSDNIIYCLGTYGSGSYTAGVYGSFYTPIPQGAIPAGSVLTQLVGGYDNSCALSAAGQVYCWGRNNYGQLGNGNRNDSAAPVAVLQGAIPAGTSALSITAGGSGNGCLIASDNQSYCWGIGYIPGGMSTVPAIVRQGARPAGTLIQSIGVNSANACQVANDGNVYCWFGNNYGELGNGTTTSSSDPVIVSGGDLPTGETMRQVGVGDSYACAVSSKANIYCWGQNSSSQLGNGSTNNSSVPVKISVPL